MRVAKAVILLDLRLIKDQRSAREIERYGFDWNFPPFPAKVERFIREGVRVHRQVPWRNRLWVTIHADTTEFERVLADERAKHDLWWKRLWPWR